MKRLTVIAIVIFTSAISFSEAAEILNFLVNGVKTEPGRYPTYVSLRDKNNTDSSKSGSGTGSGTGTGNGSGSSSGSSASSPPRSSSSSTNSTKPLTHFCGASLISDWLVLTSAHCVPNNQAAQPSNFRAAGLNFTSLPNAYVPSVRYDDQVTAFIGADRLDLGDAVGNPIQLWFVHPWFDINTYQYDVAIGMLTTPNRTAPKANLGISSTDIYNIFNNSTELYAIGLGNRLSAQQSKVLAALSNNYVDPNNDPEEELEEVLLGTLTPRVTCGIALTNYSVDTYTNGNGNVEYPYLYSTASIISNGQFCLQPRDPNSVPPVVGQSSGQGSDISVLKLYNDTCQGDSGGPVFKKGANSSSDLVVGLVSWGYGCGLGLPSVYANLGAFMNSTQFDNYLSFVMSKIPNSLNGTATRGGPAPASSVAALAPTATVAVRSTQGSLQEANGSLGKAPASSVTVTAASPKGSSVG